MSRIVHFELPAESPERMAEFYKKALGWTIDQWKGGMVDYWLISTGPQDQPGIDGAIARRREQPTPGVLITAQVDTVDATLKEIVAAGGSIVSPKRVIPGVGWQVAYP
jgi:uncharacterized protein